MHSTAKGCLLALALAASSNMAYAQPSPSPAPATASSAASTAPGRPLPKEDQIITTSLSTDKWSVAPYKFYDLPYSTREKIAKVDLVKPSTETGLADTFLVLANQDIGSTTLVLPLFDEKTGQRFERRIELIVVDELSEDFRLYIEATIRRLFPNTSIQVAVAGPRTAVVSGFVERAELVGPIIDLVRGFLADGGGQGDAGTATVVNAIRVVGAYQVQLKVVVAEVFRSKVRELGFNWIWNDLTGTGLQGAIGSFPNLTLAQPASVANGAISATQLGQATLPFTLTRTGTFSFDGFLRALVTNNLARIMAEPTLVTTSGSPAFFNAGGEFPFAAAAGLGQAQVQFRPFGTSVRFVPTVLGNGRIRLEVKPEVSAIEQVFNQGGILAPSLRVRTVETTVELESGQTFALAGLVDKADTVSTVKIPFVADLPLVGWAFQSKSYRQEERELLILVTPMFVEAMDEQPCKLPGRESRIPNDVEWFWGSKFEPPCFPDPYKFGVGPCPTDRPTATPVPKWTNYGRPEPLNLLSDAPLSNGPNALPMPTPAGTMVAPATVAPTTMPNSSPAPAPAKKVTTPATPRQLQTTPVSLKKSGPVSEPSLPEMKADDLLGTTEVPPLPKLRKLDG